MFEKVTPENLKMLRRGIVKDGVAYCPRCRKALLQVLDGGGGVVTWCRGCKVNIWI